MSLYLLQELTGDEAIYAATEKPPAGPDFNKALASKYPRLQIWSIGGGQVEYRMVTGDGIIVARRKIFRHAS